MKMGVFGILKQRREEFVQQRTIKKANKLAGLKSERVKQEGRAKIDRAYDEEIKLTKTAKREQFDRSFAGKSIAGLKKFQANNKKRNANMSSSTSTRTELNPAFDMSKDKKRKNIFD